MVFREILGFADFYLFLYFLVFFVGESSGSRRGVVGEWLSEEKQGKTMEKMVVGESVGESSGSPSGSRRGVVGESSGSRRGVPKNTEKYKNK